MNIYIYIYIYIYITFVIYMSYICNLYYLYDLYKLCWVQKYTLYILHKILIFKAYKNESNIIYC